MEYGTQFRNADNDLSQKKVQKKVILIFKIEIFKISQKAIVFMFRILIAGPFEAIFRF